MKKLFNFTIFASLMLAVFAISSFAQCEARKIALTNGAKTITGTTGSCQRFSFDITAGQRVKVSIASTESKARFVIQNGADDDTGTTGWGPMTAFDKVLNEDYWEVGVTATSTVSYTLKITVTDE